MAVVIVESPAKAKTINKYLGKDFTVLASYGHVRDLPSKDGSVDPENEFEMKWEVDTKSKKQLSDIAAACKGTDKLILATDPDREGEAISWHLLEALYKRRALKKDVPVERVVFNAITKTAVTQAMKEPREVDMELVEAYLARRALDYLVGFNLSPVLWRKLPGSRSAGRVQSVCLRLVVEREMEIDAFKAREYWSIKTGFTTPGKADFEGRLVSLDGKKLERFDLATEEDATRAVDMIEARDFSVKSVEAKPATRNPSPPFMTSTLQQEASRKLGMGAQQAMRAAQKLYEQGHITYMRTDGIDMAPEAIAAVREAIGDRYSKDYVPSKPREYKVKAKNAQEAHEAIRPTDFTKAANDLKIDGEEKKLYDLIWKRAVSSQMESARLERTVVEIDSADGKVGLRATGQVIKFDGFLKVYEEGKDEVASDEEDSALLPAMSNGDSLKRGKTKPEQHFTQPPPRYTEASLVKRMEELGIGRPSTYASIVTVIQDRGYVTKDKNRLIAEDKGRLVTAFLENYFKRYVEYDFTADLEERLDDVSAGKLDWKSLLKDFWTQFSADVGETKELRVSEVLDVINERLGDHVFKDRGDGMDPRSCPICGKEMREGGMLSIKTSSKFGAFIGCTNYPECRYTRAFGVSEEEAAAQAAAGDGKELGIDPETGKPVTLKSGRFGPYVQLGEPEGEGKEKTKPPRGSIPKGVDVDDVDFDLALKLINLPRVIGKHPEDGEEITAAIGRYGPFVKCGKTYANLSEWQEVFEVGMNRAVELITEKRENPRAGRGRAAAKPPLKELGEHPEEGGPMNVLDGRYGPYVKWGKVNATIPKDVKPEDVTAEMAVELIAKKRAK
jgi:DNA topoisomerase-1